MQKVAIFSALAAALALSACVGTLDPGTNWDDPPADQLEADAGLPGSDTLTNQTKTDAGPNQAKTDCQAKKDDADQPTVEADSGLTEPDPDSQVVEPDSGAPQADSGPTADSLQPDSTALTPDSGPTAQPDSQPTPDSTPTTLPDPVVATQNSDGSCSLALSSEYIKDGQCVKLFGEVMGNVPSGWPPQASTAPVMSWSDGIGIVDAKATGWLKHGFQASWLTPGTYALSYQGKANGTLFGKPFACGLSADSWADFGDGAKIAQMAASGQGWISCNWYDSSTGKVVSVSSPSCSLKVTVTVSNGKCTFAPAGNMTGYTGN